MNRREKRIRRGRPASGGTREFSDPIIHHPVSFINCDGFTLIELLVVISIVALLMAVLMPVLSRVRKQTRAVACQANLRQWGAFLAMYVNENDGRLPEPPAKDDTKYWMGWFAGGWGWEGWRDQDPSVYKKTKNILCCPMASKPANPTGTWGEGQGGTFLAWGLLWPEGQEPVPGWNPYGSYGMNSCVAQHWQYSNDEMRTKAWHTADVPRTSIVPVYFDHTSPVAWAWKWDYYGGEPPACDAIPIGSDSAAYMSPCINRHDARINAAFLDWSVRAVGLKELWTLKWNRLYNTSGSWTKAGGVQPEDWPQWMRGFKDY